MNQILKLTVDNCHWDNIKNGRKKVEGRLPKFGIEHAKINDILNIIDYDERSLNVKIEFKIWYPSIREYLNIHLNDALPDINTVEEGISIYRKYISELTENKLGIYAIGIKII